MSTPIAPVPHPVFASPDDDAARLAFADAIATAEPERAELIRAQCALAGVREEDSRFAELQVRAARARALEAWDDDLRRIPDVHWVYDRGLVGVLGASADTLVKHAEELARHPIRSFAVELKARDAKALAESGALVHARELTLIGPAKAQREVLASQLPNLRKLWLSTDARSLAALLELESMSRLHELEVQVTADADEAATRLAEAPSLAGLSHLGFASKQAACGVPGHQGPGDVAPAADSAIASLARSPHLRGLVSLHLGALEGPLAAKALGDMDRPALEELVIRDIDEEAGPVLAASSLVGQLRRLDMVYAGRRAALALAANPGARSLRSLAIPGLLQRKEPIGDEGLAALARSPHLVDLEVLQASSCGFGPEGIFEMAEAGAFSRLAILNVQGSKRLGMEGMRALARWMSGASSSLHTLYLPLEDDEPASLIAPLLACAGAEGLRRLDVYGPTEARGDEVIRALAAASLPRLSHFAMARSVNSPSFLTGGAKALLASATLPSLALLWARLLKVSKGAKEALRERFVVFDSQGDSGLGRVGVSRSSR